MLALHSRVQIYKTGSLELDGKYGKITGCSNNQPNFKIWIVTLDVPMQDGTSTVNMPEVCLLVAPDRYPPYPNNDYYDIFKEVIPDDKWTRKFDEMNPVVGQCSKCGRTIQQMEMYWCAQNGCPTQTQVWL